MAEGKTHAEEEEEQGHRRGTSLYCKLTLQEVREALDFQAKQAPEKTTTLNKRVLETTAVAYQLAVASAGARGSGVGQTLKLLRNHTAPARSQHKSTASQPSASQVETSIDTDTHDWQAAYAKWNATLNSSKGKIPNEKQRQVIDIIHATCVREEGEKHRPEVFPLSSPLLRHPLGYRPLLDLQCQ